MTDVEMGGVEPRSLLASSSIPSSAPTQNRLACYLQVKLQGVQITPGCYSVAGSTIHLLHNPLGFGVQGHPPVNLPVVVASTDSNDDPSTLSKDLSGAILSSSPLSASQEHPIQHGQSSNAPKTHTSYTFTRIFGLDQVPVAADTSKPASSKGTPNSSMKLSPHVFHDLEVDRAGSAHACTIIYGVSEADKVGTLFGANGLVMSAFKDAFRQKNDIALNDTKTSPMLTISMSVVEVVSDFEVVDLLANGPLNTPSTSASYAVMESHSKAMFMLANCIRIRLKHASQFSHLVVTLRVENSTDGSFREHHFVDLRGGHEVLSDQQQELNGPLNHLLKVIRNFQQGRPVSCCSESVLTHILRHCFEEGVVRLFVCFDPSFNFLLSSLVVFKIARFFGAVEARGVPSPVKIIASSAYSEAAITPAVSSSNDLDVDGLVDNIGDEEDEEEYLEREPSPVLLEVPEIAQTKRRGLAAVVKEKEKTSTVIKLAKQPNALSLPASSEPTGQKVSPSPPNEAKSASENGAQSQQNSIKNIALLASLPGQSSMPKNNNRRRISLLAADSSSIVNSAFNAPLSDSLATSISVGTSNDHDLDKLLWPQLDNESGLVSASSLSSSTSLVSQPLSTDQQIPLGPNGEKKNPAPNSMTYHHPPYLDSKNIITKPGGSQSEALPPVHPSSFYNRSLVEHPQMRLSIQPHPIQYLHQQGSVNLKGQSVPLGYLQPPRQVLEHTLQPRPLLSEDEYHRKFLEYQQANEKLYQQNLLLRNQVAHPERVAYNASPSEPMTQPIRPSPIPGPSYVTRSAIPVPSANEKSGTSTESIFVRRMAKIYNKKTLEHQAEIDRLTQENRELAEKNNSEISRIPVLERKASNYATLEGIHAQTLDEKRKAQEKCRELSTRLHAASKELRDLRVLNHELSAEIAVHYNALRDVTKERDAIGERTDALVDLIAKQEQRYMQLDEQLKREQADARKLGELNINTIKESTYGKFAYSGHFATPPTERSTATTDNSQPITVNASAFTEKSLIQDVGVQVSQAPQASSKTARTVIPPALLRVDRTRPPPTGTLEEQLNQERYEHDMAAQSLALMSWKYHKLCEKVQARQKSATNTNQSMSRKSIGGIKISNGWISGSAKMPVTSLELGEYAAGTSKTDNTPSIPLFSAIDKCKMAETGARSLPELTLPKVNSDSSAPLLRPPSAASSANREGRNVGNTALHALSSRSKKIMKASVVALPRALAPGVRPLIQPVKPRVLSSQTSALLSQGLAQVSSEPLNKPSKKRRLREKTSSVVLSDDSDGEVEGSVSTSGRTTVAIPKKVTIPIYGKQSLLQLDDDDELTVESSGGDFRRSAFKVPKR